MKKYQNFSSEKFPFLVVKFSIYLNRRVFVMLSEYSEPSGKTAFIPKDVAIKMNLWL